MSLTSKQRAQLRGLANNIDMILIVGKDGIGDNLVQQANEALEARELIKGRVLETSLMSAREAAEALAPPDPRSEVVQVIGTKFVLYRPSHKKDLKNKIVLVADKERKRNTPIYRGGSAVCRAQTTGAPFCRGGAPRSFSLLRKPKRPIRRGNGPMRTSAPTKYALHRRTGACPRRPLKEKIQCQRARRLGAP